MEKVSAGINIYSGETGLGAALTNPTELARSKKVLQKMYPVVFENKRWPDVEAAYKALKGESAPDNDHLMVCLISQKFIQHQALLEEVKSNGGVAFLEKCSHFTGAKTESAKSWEGQGKESRFIRNLIHAYEHAIRKEEPNRSGQDTLF